MQYINLFGLKIANVNMIETINLIDLNLKKKESNYVVFTPNTDFIIESVRNSNFNKTLNSADLLIPDGMPLVWTSKFIGTPLKEKVSGSTLFYKICELSHKNNYSIYLLGGNEGVAEKAAKKLSQIYPNINIVGIKYVPFGFEDDIAASDKIIEELNIIKPDILIVGLGSGQGERWIVKNKDKYHAFLSIQLGASLSFAAGYYKMPPEWIKNIGFAWLWQLIEQPRRQWKRPLRGLKIFLYMAQVKYLKKEFYSYQKK
ncbi:MAG: WecB/TagA/CpsF family glycosyltransferase [bacterium]